MNVLAIIPARAGSKGIPGKNLAVCGGRPLVDWVLAAAEESRLVTSAVLSSDSAYILDRADGFGKVRAVHRHPSLAQDDTSTEAVIGSVLGFDPPEIVVLLQPTSPLTRGEHIDEAIQRLLYQKADSLLSVVRSHSFLWDERSGVATPSYPLSGRPRRQEMNQFEENGAIYAFTFEHWARTGNRLGGRIALYEMSEEHRLQVDSPFDLKLASLLLTPTAEDLVFAAFEHILRQGAVPA